jgi:hypothetical protein
MAPAKPSQASDQSEGDDDEQQPSLARLRFVIFEQVLQVP